MVGASDSVPPIPFCTKACTFPYCSAQRPAHPHTLLHKGLHIPIIFCTKACTSPYCSAQRPAHSHTVLHKGLHIPICSAQRPAHPHTVLHKGLHTPILFCTKVYTSPYCSAQRPAHPHTVLRCDNLLLQDVWLLHLLSYIAYVNGFAAHLLADLGA